MRINIREQVLNFLCLLLVQLPLIYKITLLDSAFAFFYVGFLVLLPVSITRIYLLLIGFFSGLLVDVFTNTPGMHAYAAVLIMYVRNFWLGIIRDDVADLSNLNVGTLKVSGFLTFVFPLVFTHHLMIFFIENGGLHLFGMVMRKVFFSSIFSTFIILVFNFLVSPRSKRL